MQYKTFLTIVKVFIFIILIIGILWLVFGSILYNKYTDFSQVSEYNAIRAGFILAIGFCCFQIVWSTLGLITVCRKLIFLLSVYNVGIFFILLISLTILGLEITFVVKLSSYGDDKNCIEQSTLRRLKDLNYYGVNTLCQSQCKCLFKGSSEEALNSGIVNYNPNSGETRVQNCAFYDQDNSLEDQRGLSDLLRYFEETFDCSGICTKNSYYVFSNVNNGKPNKDCKIEVIDYLRTNLNRILQASAVTCFALLISFISSCCLQYKKLEDKDFNEKGELILVQQPLLHKMEKHTMIEFQRFNSS